MNAGEKTTKKPGRILAVLGPGILVAATGGGDGQDVGFSWRARDAFAWCMVGSLTVLAILG